MKNSSQIVWILSENQLPCCLQTLCTLLCVESFYDNHCSCVEKRPGRRSGRTINPENLQKCSSRFQKHSWWTQAVLWAFHWWRRLTEEAVRTEWSRPSVTVGVKTETQLSSFVAPSHFYVWVDRWDSFTLHSPWSQDTHTHNYTHTFYTHKQTETHSHTNLHLQTHISYISHTHHEQCHIETHKLNLTQTHTILLEHTITNKPHSHKHTPKQNTHSCTHLTDTHISLPPTDTH